MRSRRGVTVMCVVAALAAAIGATSAQRVDRSRPPVLQTAAPGFTVRRLPGPVPIDGTTWTAAEPMSSTDTIFARSGGFALSLSDPTDEGDLERFQLSFADGSGPPVVLSAYPVSYVYLTRDSRWIFFEPLQAVDVTTWRLYDLSKALDIHPYVVPDAISADGRRLVVWRRDCPLDCPGVAREYYEIGLPGD